MWQKGHIPSAGALQTKSKVPAEADILGLPMVFDPCVGVGKGLNDRCGRVCRGIVGDEEDQVTEALLENGCDCLSYEDLSISHRHCNRDKW